MRELLKSLVRPALRMSGGYEAAWTLLAMAGRRRPYSGLTSWMDIAEETRAQMKRAESSGTISPPNGVSLLLHSDNQYWSGFATSLAAVLAGLGYRLDLLQSTHPFADSPTSPQDLRFIDWSKRHRVEPMHERIRIIDIRAAEPAADLPADVRERVHNQSRFDTKHILTDDEVDLSAGTKDARMFELRYERNEDYARRLLTWLEDHEYDGALTPHAVACEFGLFHYLTTRAGLRCTSFEFLDSPEKIMASMTVPIMADDTGREWRMRRDYALDDTMRDRVRTMLQQREEEGSVPGSLFVHQSTAKLGVEKITEELGLLRDQPAFLMCPNAIGDTKMQNVGRCFPSLRPWVTETLDFFAARPSAQLVVRASPAENMRPPRQRVGEIAQNHFAGRVPDNIRVIPAEDEINTYGLMDLCDAALVYNSTVGMEMAARGKLVLTVAAGRYIGKGFTSDPKTAQEYFQVLDEWIAAREPLCLDPEKRDLAWRYVYFYYYEWPRPFPWHGNPTGFRRDIVRHPVVDVLSPKGRERYQKTFDWLATGADTKT